MIDLTRFSGIARDCRRLAARGSPVFRMGDLPIGLFSILGVVFFDLGNRVFESGSHVLNDLTAVTESEDHSPNMASYKQMRQ